MFSLIDYTPEKDSIWKRIMIASMSWWIEQMVGLFDDTCRGKTRMGWKIFFIEKPVSKNYWQANISLKICGAATEIFTEPFVWIFVTAPHEIEQIANHREYIMCFMIRTATDQGLELLAIWHCGIVVRKKILSAGIFRYATSEYCFSNFGLPRLVSMLRMVR